MYCSQCGKSNEDYALYCANDGYDLQHNSNEMCLKPLEAGYCSACGAAMAMHAAYCSACGEEAGNYLDYKNKDTSLLKPAYTISKQEDSVLRLDFRTYLKKGMLGGITAVVILVLLCMTISIALNKQIPEMMTEGYPVIDVLDHYEVDSDFEILGIAETAMAVNLISSSVQVVEGNSLFNTAKITIHAGLIILLIVPLVALVIGGYISARFYRISGNRESLMVSMVIGLYYAAGLLIISRFAGFTIQIGSDMVYFSKLIYSFSWLESLLIGWLLGTWFSWMGSKLYAAVHKNNKRLRDKSAAAQAIRAVLVGNVVLSILAFVFIMLKVGKEIPISTVLFAAPQLGLYLFNLAHLGSLRFGSGEEKLQYSLFSGLHSPGGEAGLYNVVSYPASNFLDGYVYYSLFAALIVLVWIGYNYVKSIRQRPDFLSSILIFSVSYGALMAVLTKISSIGFSMDEGGQIEGDMIIEPLFVNFHMGYIFLSGFFISLVLLLLISYLSRQQR